MTNVAVVLSGCGVFDGAEIHESVLCLLALSQGGHKYHCFAPDIPQAKVVNHLTNEDSPESRNVLVEAARIARGDISPLSDLKASDYDALLFPGGFGAALNLSTFATEGVNCSVNDKVKRVVQEFHEAGKPIGATCISPAFLAKIFQGKKSVTLTLGSDPGFQSKLEEMGMQGVAAEVDDVVADNENKIYTTPCYQNPPDLAGMFKGVQKLVGALTG